MELDFGQSYKFNLTDEKILEISVYQHKWFTTISMNVWEPNNSVSLVNEKRHFNFENIMPRYLADKLITYIVNRQSRKVAGINIIK